MGSALSGWKNYFFSFLISGGRNHIHAKLVIVGLDSAGKTTLLYQLKLPGEKVETIPTIGFNVESYWVKKLLLTIWDVGGQERIRKLWKSYLDNLSGLLFVIDSSDSDRFEECKKEFQYLLEEVDKDVPFLVFSNKIDKENSRSVIEIENLLDVQNSKRKIKVFPCCATTGKGLDEGLDWLVKQIK